MRDIAEVMGILKEIRKKKNLSVANVADYILSETGSRVSSKLYMAGKRGIRNRILYVLWLCASYMMFQIYWSFLMAIYRTWILNCETNCTRHTLTSRICRRRQDCYWG